MDIFKGLFLVAMFISVAENSMAEEVITKSDITKWAATIDVCRDKGLVQKDHIIAELYPRTRYWVHENLTDKDKSDLNDLIETKRNKIKNVTKEKCEIINNKLMALTFPGRETVSAVKADIEKIKNEFDAILGACNKLIPALENVYMISKSVDESGRRDENAKAEIIEYIDIAVSNSDRINKTLNTLKQDGRLPYLFVSDALRIDYDKFTQRMLVDRLQGDKEALMEDSLKLSASVCSNLHEAAR